MEKYHLFLNYDQKKYSNNEIFTTIIMKQEPGFLAQQRDKKFF